MKEQNEILLKQCKVAYKFGIVSFIVITLIAAIFIYFKQSIYQILIQAFSMSMIFWSIRKLEKIMDSVKKRLKEYEREEL